MSHQFEGNQKQSIQNNQQAGVSYGGKQQQQPAPQSKVRAQSHGQNLNQQVPPVKKPKDAYSLIQEQQRAEQAKQPQN